MEENVSPHFENGFEGGLLIVKQQPLSYDIALERHTFQKNNAA